MYKKFIQSSLVIGVLILGVQASFANTSSGSGYNAPVVRTSFDFTATPEAGKVSMSWVPYAPSGFNYYKVVRSTTNANPVYPDDGYIYYTGEANASSYVDNDPPAGKVHYRVCSIASPNRYCSPVVTLSVSGVSQEETKSESSEVVPATLSLSAKAMDGVIGLTWTVAGSTPYGFKICKSAVNEKPTYPVIQGDAYQYLTDPAVRSLKDSTVKAGQTYHYRVCQYDGNGTCLSYSNAVSVAMKTDGASATEDKTLVSVSTEAVKEAAVEKKFEEQSGLKDIENHPYVEAIGYLLSKNIVQGYSDNTFRPNSAVNRAEFVKMILNSKFGDKAVGAKANCFRDVKVAWYSPYVCFAKEKGIVSGYKDGTFKPSMTITFAEASKIVSELYGIDTQAGPNWYAGYVKALQNRHYIPPTVTAPEKKLTRGEVAELMWRVKEQKTDQPSAEVSDSGSGESVVMATGEYSGWQTFEKNGYSFYYPAGWYRGLKSYGWDMLSEERDYIDNLNVQNYMAVDTYVATYVAVRSAATKASLATKVAFGHPLVSSKSLTVNGFSALRRSYRAPAGTVVNGRTTGENEIIIAYTYLKDGKIIMIQYFNASGNESYGVDQFDKIAMSLR